VNEADSDSMCDREEPRWEAAHPEREVRYAIDTIPNQGARTPQVKSRRNVIFAYLGKSAAIGGGSLSGYSDAAVGNRIGYMYLAEDVRKQGRCNHRSEGK
jgi:hypothetical protein